MKSGMKGGNIYAANIQMLDGTISTDGNGDGSVSLTFRQKMKKIPRAIPGIEEADTTGTVSIIERSQTAVAIQVDGSSVTSGVLSVNAICMDDTYF